MRWRVMILFVVAALSPLNVTRANEGPQEMLPSGPWVADFADDSCSLERKFGDGADLVTLRLRQFGPQRDFEVTLVGRSLRLQFKHPKYAFLPGDKQDIEFYQTAKMPGGERALIFTAAQFKPDPDSTEGSLVPATQVAATQAADRLSFESVFIRDVTLRTGTLREPLRIMQQCLDDLLSSWDLDAQAHHNLSRPVTELEGKTWPNWLAGKQMSVVTQWPSDRIQFRLLVDEAGHVADCRISGAPQTAALAEKICNVMPKDYTFLPALDANKHPVKSYYLTTIIRVRRSGEARAT